MLDIKYIRENPTKVQRAALSKGVKIDIKKLILIDKKRSLLIEKRDKLRGIRKSEKKPTAEEIKKSRSLKKS